MAYLTYDIYGHRHPREQPLSDPTKQNLVILGTGWGAVSLLKNLDATNYNVTVVSPRNYFLFTPLLPSCTTGTIEHRSIMEPIRSVLRHTNAAANYYEAEVRHIDAANKTVLLSFQSAGAAGEKPVSVKYDKLVIAVGAESATFGVPGVKENACFLKEIGDAQEIRKRIMNCIETATFKDQPQEEIERLLHTVVVGGGPTGVEFAAELQDFLDQDIRKWVPEIGHKAKVTVIEALPSVLPMFSKDLINYTESVFKEGKIDIRTKTAVKQVTDRMVEVEYIDATGEKVKEAIPYGLIVWATGNAIRPVVKDFLSQIDEQKESRRGIAVDGYLAVNGAEDIWAIGDCAVAGYAPTAQVASQEAVFLAKLLFSTAQKAYLEQRVGELNQSLESGSNDAMAVAAELKSTQKLLQGMPIMKPFRYSHQGAMAYIGQDKAVADVAWSDGNFSAGGGLTYLFWRSAYLSMCFSTRNRILVVLDWMKSKAFGRDVSRE